MSDLAATHCGDRCERRESGFSCIWIIIILLFCCNGSNGIFGGGFGCGGSENGCSSIIFIILILCLCGGNGFGF